MFEDFAKKANMELKWKVSFVISTMHMLHKIIYYRYYSIHIDSNLYYS